MQEKKSIMLKNAFLSLVLLYKHIFADESCVPLCENHFVNHMDLDHEENYPFDGTQGGTETSKSLRLHKT